jgi:dTDP-4-amino-4,6-dideoxygalactose transaminase
MVRLLDLHKQYLSIKSEIDAAIADVIRETAFIGGKYAEAFEERFASYLGDEMCCIGVANGTDALELSLAALDLPAGSEVIVPANSFIATSEAVTSAGLKVVFADCDVDYTISIASLSALLGENTSAVIAVHLYGQPARLDEIQGVLEAFPNVRLIEDCAQAHGAEFRGKKVGTFGAVSAFSFYPGKVLGAYGDAGCVVTPDGALARRVRMLANHGRSSRHLHEVEGRNSRLDGIQAAVLNVKLDYLDGWIEARTAIARTYGESLPRESIALPPVRKGIRHAWHLYVIRHSRRDSLREFLAERDIQTGIHYPFALPNLPAYARVADRYRSYFACRTDRELLSLPIGEHMDPADAVVVADAIRDWTKPS